MSKLKFDLKNTLIKLDHLIILHGKSKSGGNFKYTFKKFSTDCEERNIKEMVEGQNKNVDKCIIQIIAKFEKLGWYYTCDIVEVKEGEEDEI